MGQENLLSKACGGGRRAGLRAGLPALPPAGRAWDCQTPALSLTSLIWKMGPKGTTTLRQVGGADLFFPLTLISTWSRGSHWPVAGLGGLSDT